MKIIVAEIRCALILLLPSAAYAGSAQWELNPTSGDWNMAENWMPATVPNGPADTATFAVSNSTSISVSSNTETNGITFDPDASAYTISALPNITLTLSGAGITNNSGTTQNFSPTASGTVNNGQIVFSHSATAGTSTAFTNYGAIVNGTGFGGGTRFMDTSSAGHGVFTNSSGAVSGNDFFQGGGFTEFSDAATADNGTFINKGGADGVVVRRSFSVRPQLATACSLTKAARLRLPAAATPNSTRPRTPATAFLSTTAPLSAHLAVHSSMMPRARATVLS